MAVGLRIGRYEIGERLGTGGFGVVYHARDSELGRELAIKVLRPEYQTQPDVVARFLKEARAAAKIDHPGIVTVFECGTIGGTGTAQDGNAYIAMELLRGHSLTQHLERKGRMTVGDAILVARQVAGALSVAHAAGIVHRDLKPDNVFLLPDPLVKGGFRIKILDFGVAKLAEPKEVGVNTHSQVMLGTPKYMSPEQARSARSVDPRTDIYTLGCMLYEMVTGQSPYDGPGAIDLIIQHTTSPIPSPAAIVHGLPPAFDKLVQQMLGKEPEERPESMPAVDAMLERIQAELEAPRPKPPTSPPAIPPTPARPPARPTPAPPPTPQARPSKVESLPPTRPSQAESLPARPSKPEMPRSSRPEHVPSGLTPTPAIALSQPKLAAAPLADSGEQLYPTQPVARPVLVASGTAAQQSPFPPFTTSGFPPSLDDERTERATERDSRPSSHFERRAPRSESRATLFIVVGVVVAALAAGVVWFALRDKPGEKSNPVTTTTQDAGTVATGPKLEPEALVAVKKDCEDFQRIELWKELKDCADKLKANDLKLAEKYWKTADDEAANAKKWQGVQDHIKAKEFGPARDLMKRIGDNSVYTKRARKALADAEANP